MLQHCLNRPIPHGRRDLGRPRRAEVSLAVTEANAATALQRVKGCRADGSLAGDEHFTLTDRATETHDLTCLLGGRVHYGHSDSTGSGRRPTALLHRPVDHALRNSGRGTDASGANASHVEQPVTAPRGLEDVVARARDRANTGELADWNHLPDRRHHRLAGRQDLCSGIDCDRTVALLRLIFGGRPEQYPAEDDRRDEHSLAARAGEGQNDAVHAEGLFADEKLTFAGGYREALVVPEAGNRVAEQPRTVEHLLRGDCRPVVQSSDNPVAGEIQPNHRPTKQQLGAPGDGGFSVRASKP